MCGGSAVQRFPSKVLSPLQTFTAYPPQGSVNPIIGILYTVSMNRYKEGLDTLPASLCASPDEGTIVAVVRGFVAFRYVREG